MDTKSSSKLIKPSLKNVETEVRHYITQLEKENLKLHSKIAKLQVANLSISNENKAYKAEIAKLTKQIDKQTTKPVFVLPEQRPVET